MPDINKMKLLVIRPHIPQRRDNEARPSSKLDDLFARYVFLDEWNEMKVRSKTDLEPA